MKPISDLIQIGISLPGALGFVAAVGLVLLVLQFAKSLSDVLRGVGIAFRWLRARFIRLSVRRMFFVCLAAVPVFFCSSRISATLQYFEQIAVPAYVNGDTSERALVLYEAALDKTCDTWEAGVVKRRTREIAAKIGCSPLAIYEVAYSECGLDPFRIRTDGKAAGWIQFTVAGSVGITSLPEVKQACKNRDVKKMMEWTETYLVSRAKGKPMRDATDIYVCVFAPGFLGADDSQVLYEGWSNPNYYLNKIFDGYHIDHKGRIMRTDGAMDGKITIREMRLHLEAKKSRFLRK